MEVWAHTVEPGMAVLVERMLATAGAELRLGQRVTRIEQGPDHVVLSLTDGTQVSSEFCTLALGVNQLAPIKIWPALSDDKIKIINRGHGGRSFKIWIKAVGVQVGTLVTGNGQGIEFAFAERATDDGATLVVGFGLMDFGADPANRTWVNEQFARLFPNVRIIAHDWHNWVGDPFSNGTWVAAPVGLEHTLDERKWQSEGRLFFASSDFAREQAGWFEAAVISGEDAAEGILRVA